MDEFKDEKKIISKLLLLADKLSFSGKQTLYNELDKIIKNKPKMNHCCEKLSNRCTCVCDCKESSDFVKKLPDNTKKCINCIKCKICEGVLLVEGKDWIWYRNDWFYCSSSCELRGNANS